MNMSQNRLASDLDHVLDHTRELWDELRGQRIFITGGTGFFGCWLLESFAWANDRLGLNATALVLSRNLDAFRKKVPHLADHHAIQFHIGDIRSYEFPTGSFSHIIHAATESSATLNAESPLIMFDTIVEGTRRTLEFARQCGARKFLLTSSGAVYGKQPPGMTHIPEEYQGAPDPNDPRSAYGEGKRSAELLCAIGARQHGIEAKIARCFAFVGPYLPLDIHYAIGNFIRDGLNGGPIVVLGDGTPRRSYLYAADLAIWLWTILFKGQSCRPYNVGSDDSISIAEIAKSVAAQFPKRIEIDVRGIPDPKKLLELYVPDVSRAINELGLKQNITLSKGISRTIAFQKWVEQNYLGKSERQ
jgi:nucleoside-diphosphate-sugar epimerase